MVYKTLLTVTVKLWSAAKVAVPVNVGVVLVVVKVFTVTGPAGAVTEWWLNNHLKRLIIL